MTLYYHFSGDDIEGATAEMNANMYLQEALVIFWMRENPDIGLEFWKEEFKLDNVKKVQSIQTLCSLALRAKPDYHHAK